MYQLPGLQDNSRDKDLEHCGVLMQPDDFIRRRVDQPHRVDVPIASIAVTQPWRQKMNETAYDVTMHATLNINCIGVRLGTVL